MKICPFLQFPFPEKEIFLRLGGHLTKTELFGEVYAGFRSAALRAFEWCDPQGRWDIAAVDEVNGDGIVLKDGSVIPGGDFARRCQGISHLWFGAVTIGNVVLRERDAAPISDAAVYDAAASECADAAMDSLQKLAGAELLRLGLVLNQRRYSPGYGDMPLDVQQFFFDRLRLEELDMVLNENMFITPEKSVTALAGVTMLQGGN